MNRQQKKLDFVKATQALLEKINKGGNQWNDNMRRSRYRWARHRFHGYYKARLYRSLSNLMHDAEAAGEKELITTAAELMAMQVHTCAQTNRDYEGFVDLVLIKEVAPALAATFPVLRDIVGEQTRQRFAQMRVDESRYMRDRLGLF